MRLDTIIQKLLPKDDKFYILLEDATKNLVRVGETLKKVSASTSIEQRAAIAKEIKELEHNGDGLTHTIFSELNATFVTPFDREDIHLLASAIDDVVDYIDGSASRMVLYRIDEIPDSMRTLIDVLCLSIGELHKGVHLLRTLGKFDELRDVFKNINDYENQADTLFEQAIADLFDNEKDPIKVIKVKEVYVGLETATDKCEDAGNVLESILIKHN